jgi:hypothetical protein
MPSPVRSLFARAPRRGVRLAGLAGVAALATVALMGALPGIGSATSAGLSGSFESADGNTVKELVDDWRSVASTSIVVGDDQGSGQSDDSMGQGTKEDSTSPSIVTGSIPNNKSDLMRFLLHSDAGTSTGHEGHNFLYLGWQRLNTLGTANMDFELNQNAPVAVPVSGSNPVRYTYLPPARRDGDVLVTFDFASGGKQVNLGLLRWLVAGSGSPGSCFSASARPCWGNWKDLNASGDADGAVNDGFTTADPVSGTTIASDTFGEAAVDLTNTIFQPGGADCTFLGSAYLKSRSADSFSAAVKDFVAPKPVDVTNCRPATINLKKVGPDGTTPLAGAVLQLFRDGVQVGTDCTTTVSNPPVATDATCTFPNLGNGTYTAHEQTPPSGYSAAADQSATVTVSSAPQTITFTFTDALKRGTINVAKRDDSATPQALNGAVFTLYAGSVDGTAVATCTTGNTASLGGTGPGACHFTDVALGGYWVVETGVPAGYAAADPQPVTIGVGSAPDTGDIHTLTFTDPRLYKVIVVVCDQASGQLHRSDVTLDPTVGSLSSLGHGATLPTGTTEAGVCALSGASFTGKVHNSADAGSSYSYPGSVHIPQ